METSKRNLSRAQIENHVGMRIRVRRIELGLTPSQLADLLHSTYQQVHKYERGISHVSAGQLYEIARVLSVSVGYFFDGLVGESRPAMPHESMQRGLVHNSALIPNEKHQEAFARLVRVLANE